MPPQSANPPDIQTLENWRGLNQQASRSSIGDDEEFWNENLFAIGPGNLRSCWGHGPPIYTAPGGVQILRMFFGFYGRTTPQFSAPPPGQMAWLFLSNGHVVEVDVSNGGATDIGAIWEPIGPQYWASAKVWRPQFFGNVAGQGGGVLFGSPQGLYAWDGTLYPPGSTAPDWLTDQQETDPGPPIYIMPNGLPGIYTMEVYQSRLFVAGKDVISFSAPSNGADFSTTDGGGSFGYFGDRLTYSFMDMAQASGYLYIFGDSSIDMIANVQLSGQGTPESPFTTNFNYVNIDPQVGQRFPRPVGRIGRYFQMFNGAGIFECRGGEAREIGNRVTNIFNTLDTSSFYPTMCPATMFGFKVLLCNGMFTDPFGVKRSLLLMWHPGQQEFWSIASQNLNLTHIGAYEQDSVIQPFGTDGTSLYKLFAQPDPALIKKLSTKFWRGAAAKQLMVKNFKRLFLEFDDNSGQGVSFTGQLIARAGGVPGGTKDIAFQMDPGQGYAFEPQPTEGAGIMGAVDLQSFSPDFTIERLHLMSEDRVIWGA